MDQCKPHKNIISKIRSKDSFIVLWKHYDRIANRKSKKSDKIDGISFFFSFIYSLKLQKNLYSWTKIFDSIKCASVSSVFFTSQFSGNSPSHWKQIFQSFLYQRRKRWQTICQFDCVIDIQQNFNSILRNLTFFYLFAVVIGSPSSDYFWSCSSKRRKKHSNVHNLIVARTHKLNLITSENSDFCFSLSFSRKNLFSCTSVYANGFFRIEKRIFYDHRWVKADDFLSVFFRFYESEIVINRQFV